MILCIQKENPLNIFFFSPHFCPGRAIQISPSKVDRLNGKKDLYEKEIVSIAVAALTAITFFVFDSVFYSMAFRLSFIFVFTIFGLSISVTSKVNPKTINGIKSHINQLTFPTAPNPIVLNTSVANPIPTG